MLERNPVVGTPGERLLRRLALYVLAPALLILEIPVAIHVAQRPDTGLAVHNLVVVSVAPASTGDLAGVKPGDRLLTIDGAPLANMIDFYVATAGHYDLRPQDYLLRRGEDLVAVTVGAERPARSDVIRGYSMSVAGFFFLLMGWLVLAQRNDPVARYFFALCACFAFFLMDIPDWPSPTYMTFKDMLRDAAILLLPALVLLFFLHFPSGARPAPGTGRRHRLLLWPVVPLFLLSLYAQAARLDPADSPLVAGLQAAATLYFLAYFLAGLVVVARKVMRRGQPVVRTKMRVVLVGLVAGFAPFLLASAMNMAAPGARLPLQEWYGFSLILVPLSFALAILRYGALDTAYVVRHSIVYGVLTAAIGLGYVVIVVVLGHILTRWFEISNTPLVVAAVAASALVAHPLRRRLVRWTETRFYPTRLATRDAIQDLSHELSQIIDRRRAAQTLIERLEALYRPGRVVLYVVDGENLSLVARRGDATPHEPAAFPVDSPLCAILTERHRPTFVEELAPGATPLPTETARQLRDLAAQLLVPLVARTRLCGILGLGARRDGTFYTQADLANLHVFSHQAAALLEILRLHGDSLEKERLETELSLAKRIQENLVPTEPLALPGAVLCGRMESCREVGGDYFDYFQRDADTVGFAIADAAGKGIPAALVMTTLRVAFRSTAARYDEPRTVVEHLNDTICGLATIGNFISFFYGVYDLRRRLLHYCNAGMNQPLLLRSGRGFSEKLKKGGLVLGINPEQPYAWGTVALQPGDLLVLYTDGLTEETDGAGEFYGEERLEHAVKAAAGGGIETIRASIFASVEEFSGGEQSDDRTLLLLRVNDLPENQDSRHHSG